MSILQSLLGLAVSCQLLIGGVPVQPAPWSWSLQATVPALELQAWQTVIRETPGQPRTKAIHPDKMRLAGSATVEVWGDDTQKTLNLFLKQLVPELRTAFRAGWSCDVSAQICGELFAMATSGKAILAPSSPSFLYNCFRPTGFDPALVAYTSGHF